VTLTVESLSVSFGRVSALDRVSLTVAPGERVGLVGPNGAGKTTLLDAIGGLVRPSRGTVHLGATRLTGLAPAQVARAGVGRTFQSPRLAPWMTVAENVRAGRAIDAAPWLALTALEHRRDELAVALTPAEGRRLELARALAGHPRVLLLDEPSGGLTAAETDGLIGLLERAAAPDRILILVEHKLGVIRRFADRVVVLHLGEQIFDGSTAAMGRDARVLEAYLGRAPAG
jgi:ABC-type branched-subunit amino acid transport system ATPase component